MGRRAPLWLIFLVQGVSVVGDTLGQRATRLHFKGSSRRMLIALSVISALQVLVVLGGLQLALPASITGAIYDDQGRTLPCYREVDFEGRLPSYCDGGGRNCTVTACPSQGPGSVPRSVGLHPLLLLNGVQSVVYYVGEVMLYQQPLGLVLIVMASLVSSFVIAPVESLFGVVEQSVPTVVVLLGLVGAVACVVEVPLSPLQRRLPLGHMYALAWRALRRGDCRALLHAVPEADDDDAAAAAAAAAAAGDKGDAYAMLTGGGGGGDGEAGAGGAAVELDGACDDGPAAAGPAGSPAGGGGGRTPSRVRALLRETLSAHVLRVAVPFLMLALIYSAWFVTQRVFNAEYRTNMYGYTALDQVLNPLYLLPTLVLVDTVRPLRGSLVPPEDRGRSFAEDARATWRVATAHRGAAARLVFAYRLLINARAMGYFYLSIAYDLRVVYFELQLIRVLLSWAAAVLLCAAPSVIAMTDAEVKTTLAPGNLALKTVGSLCILAALVAVSA